MARTWRPAAAQANERGFTLKAITPTGTAACADAGHSSARPGGKWKPTANRRGLARILRETGRDRCGTPAGGLLSGATQKRRQGWPAASEQYWAESAQIIFKQSTGS